MIFSVAISGPTASGKTGLSLELGERLSAEIISADSMQIYKEMDIGTAKATAEERGRAPHHLLDFVSPTENYSVELYREAAVRCASDISSRGKLPLFVGGTGLYLDSLARAPLSRSPGSDPEFRERLLSGIKTEEDAVALWERLRRLDPESAEKIHHNNVKRVIRALEICESTGLTKTELDRQTRCAASDIFVGMITLDFHSRELLYSRIDRRVDIMMEEGLVGEVESLYKRGLLPDGSTARQAIGYKEIIEYLEGRCSLESAAETIKLSSRRYAKRQLTWFRHTEGAYTLYMDTEDGVMRPLSEVVAEAVLAVDELYARYSSQLCAKE